MKTLTTEILWEILLRLRSLLNADEGFRHEIVIRIENGRIRIDTDCGMEAQLAGNCVIISKNMQSPRIPNSVCYYLNEYFLPVSVYNFLLDSEELAFFNTYLPYCFSFLRAKFIKRCITVLHFAQTLDGKIATNSGNSKWIGNRENLIHSHRMRALCDGVLIGTNTLNCDKPALTVRFVKGPNPAKIVIGRSAHEFESLIRNNGRVIFFTPGLNGAIKGIESITLPCMGNRIEPQEILKELYTRGIYSVYIEGGAITASSFLTGKSIDNLQLFLAPRIFGSGISNFLLPEIFEIEDSIGFSNVSFQPMGDGILFSGLVNY